MELFMSNFHSFSFISSTFMSNLYCISLISSTFMSNFIISLIVLCFLPASYVASFVLVGANATSWSVLLLFLFFIFSLGRVAHNVYRYCSSPMISNVVFVIVTACCNNIKTRENNQVVLCYLSDFNLVDYFCSFSVFGDK